MYVLKPTFNLIDINLYNLRFSINIVCFKTDSQSDRKESLLKAVIHHCHQIRNVYTYCCLQQISGPRVQAAQSDNVLYFLFIRR